MDEAEYCDRISIMVDGKISALGTPDELKRRFKQPDMDHVFTYLARQATRSGDWSFLRLLRYYDITL